MQLHKDNFYDLATIASDILWAAGACVMGRNIYSSNFFSLENFTKSVHNTSIKRVSDNVIALYVKHPLAIKVLEALQVCYCLIKIF